MDQTTQPQAAASDVFDQVSGGQSLSQPPTQQQQHDVFDQIATDSNSSVTSNPSSVGPAVPDALLHLDPSNNPLLRAAKGVNAIGAGAGEALLDTLNGGAEMLHLPHETLKSREAELKQQNRENPTLNTIGRGAEDLSEFLAGDEALKGLAWSERLLKTARVAKVLEAHPMLLKAAQLGADAMRSGAVQGTIGTVKSGGDVREGAEQGLIAGGLTGALGAGTQTVKAIAKAVDHAGIQKPLQDGIRTILGDTADKLGLNAPSSQSIRDAVQDVQQQLKGKASSLYADLDRVSGGQAQRFRDAAENVSQKLRDIVGLDDEKEAELLKRQQEIDTAHKAMLDKLEKQGFDKNALAKADAMWRQQPALNDLTNAVRQSTSGLRPELAQGASDATTSEAVNPKVLFTKINRLADRGRLADAIGHENAENLLRHVDSAYVQAQKIAQRQKWLAAAGKAVGLGSLGTAGVGLAHHLFGTPQ